MRVSKYVNQSKVINDISFTTISYRKGKVEIKAEGYQGTMWVGTQTWKSKESRSNVTRRSGFHFESKRFKACFKKIENVISNLLPTLYTPIQKNFIGVTLPESFDRMIDELGCIESIKGVRLWFKKYAKQYHPDFLGRELFLDEQITYETLVETRDAAIDEIRTLEELLEN